MRQSIAREQARPAPSRKAILPTQRDLAPPGASPAGDLQRRLAQAALCGFYVPKQRSAWQGRRQLAVMLAVASASWAIVFGAWHLLPA